MRCQQRAAFHPAAAIFQPHVRPASDGPAAPTTNETAGEPEMTDEKAFSKKLRRARAVLERLARGEGPPEEDITAAQRHDSWCVVDAGRFTVLQDQVPGPQHLAYGGL